MLQFFFYASRFNVVLFFVFATFCWFTDNAKSEAQESVGKESDPIRVFIFAGQSNMVGSDSHRKDVASFPPFEGIEQPQTNVRFWYCIGRENKMRSDGWVPLQPVNQVVGPELTFAREISKNVNSPIAIIKVAAGGTHLGGDWNPVDPIGFKMYPLLMDEVRKALVELDQKDLPWKLEGFVWHQGENDMFNQEYMDAYGENLSRFFGCVRRDLEVKDLPFYVGELCTKTIWGMDLRPRMYAISVGQKAAVGRDAHATYIPTSHIGVEIGGGVGLHYHYGTLGQLQHGLNYADAYLRSVDKATKKLRELPKWPYREGEEIDLVVLAGHRNMEGERAFIQHVPADAESQLFLRDNPTIAYRYWVGGGAFASTDWEPLGVIGRYDNFGPELSFAKLVQSHSDRSIAIAKFTHSGSQMIDWTPEGSVAISRNLYPIWIQFIQDAVADLEARGHRVKLSAVIYHVGENDMSFGPFRQSAPNHLRNLIASTRRDLESPNLRWIVSQQPPTRDENLDKIRVIEEMAKLAEEDSQLTLLQQLNLPLQPKQLVIDTQGVIKLGEELAGAFLGKP
jgi:hypothetical protein